jgi:hypothetical protein
VEFKLELKGLQDLNRKLEGRIRRLEQSVLRKALLAFGEPIRAHAEQLARATISPRMKVVITTKMRGSTGTVKIGPSTEVFETSPTGRSVTHANIGYWFEFGYDIRHKPKGPALAHVGSCPTLTPAYQAAKEQGLAAFEQVIRENLEQEVAA